ncbi:uncharacterized protein V1510DRAFT_448183, partial [Dipodascopsis tothii]|uniref:uncharacterized protein n=1 Tax=Dipodascopsis tothii TaxID=44089 RepID=UPI0034CD2AF3
MACTDPAAGGPCRPVSQAHGTAPHALRWKPRANKRAQPRTSRWSRVKCARRAQDKTICAPGRQGRTNEGTRPNTKYTMPTASLRARSPGPFGRHFGGDAASGRSLRRKAKDTKTETKNEGRGEAGRRRSSTAALFDRLHVRAGSPRPEGRERPPARISTDVGGRRAPIVSPGDSDVSYESRSTRSFRSHRSARFAAGFEKLVRSVSPIPGHRRSMDAETSRDMHAHQISPVRKSPHPSVLSSDSAYMSPPKLRGQNNDPYGNLGVGRQARTMPASSRASSFFRSKTRPADTYMLFGKTVPNPSACMSPISCATGYSDEFASPVMSAVSEGNWSSSSSVSTDSSSSPTKDNPYLSFGDFEVDESSLQQGRVVQRRSIAGLPAFTPSVHYADSVQSGPRRPAYRNYFGGPDMLSPYSTDSAGEPLDIYEDSPVSPPYDANGVPIAPPLPAYLVKGAVATIARAEGRAIAHALRASNGANAEPIALETKLKDLKVTTRLSLEMQLQDAKLRIMQQSQERRRNDLRKLEEELAELNRQTQSTRDVPSSPTTSVCDESEPPSPIATENNQLMPMSRDARHSAR